MTYQNPPGVNDLLPESAYGIQYIIRVAAYVFKLYGYRYIETPLFEKTEVFTRGIGEATDIVGKEMYYVYPMSAIDKIGEDEGTFGALTGFSLRPEGTAGTARAVVQHNLFSPGASTAKLWYAGSMFRHERQQKGRYREFRQIGAECIGATEPTADAEVVQMLMNLFTGLGIPRTSMVLKVNSMGDQKCRPAYRDAVRNYVLTRESDFCPECLRRADNNPLRVFDCKSAACQQALDGAPRITDHLCKECFIQYEMFKALLRTSDIDYVEDHRLVRGFDYYSRSVFEVQVESGLGTQNAIGGGGRYDGLLEEYGAKHTPSLGFAVGLERILMVLEDLGVVPQMPPAARVYIAAADDEARSVAFFLTTLLRVKGAAIELDHQARSLKSQLKLADKIGVEYTVIIGSDELKKGVYSLRNMRDSTQTMVTIEKLYEILFEEGESADDAGAAASVVAADAAASDVADAASDVADAAAGSDANAEPNPTLNLAPSLTPDFLSSFASTYMADPEQDSPQDLEASPTLPQENTRAVSPELAAFQKTRTVTSKWQIIKDAQRRIEEQND
ncbi:MAG: histidine--tRNA ligase [Coriobacteriia bacterium]|nr:histidine--tRNA ligase [Coriobacteriia bacterium]